MRDLIAPVRGLLNARAGTFEEHLATVGTLPSTPGPDLRALVEAAGLTGRGGAGFPTARKLAAVSAGRSAVVVANGAEGEPASSKDLVLLESAPHLVLDGLMLAARATGAGAAYLYAPEAVLRSSIRPALRQRDDRLPTILVASADTFLAGQESAVVAAVQGLRPLPAHAVPPVYRKGVDGRPTLVQNVETLAQLALVARYGADWFRDLGTEEEPGSRLLTVSGAVRKPAVYEVRGGSTLGEVISLAGGGLEPLQAILVGGYHGGWVPWDADTVELTLGRTSLVAYEATPGAGVLIALPDRRCGLQAAASIAAYLSGENAGQCGPCRNGLPTIAGHLDDLARGRNVLSAHHEILRLTGSVEGRGACHHPNGTVRMVRSALRTFRTEAEHHLRGGCTGTSSRSPS